MKDGKCPQCGSRDVMADVEVRDDGRSSSHPLPRGGGRTGTGEARRCLGSGTVNRGRARLDLRTLRLHRTLHQ